MKLTDIHRKKWLIPLLSFLIPFGGVLIVMAACGQAPFGDKSILYSDMYHQYYPFFVQYRKTLLSGQSLLHSWNVGMGMDYLGLISYYLASPLYLLSVFVPESWLLGFFSLLVPIKLGLAGLFFSIFLRKVFSKNDLSVAFFSALYGLCAWALGYMWNIMWLDTFALLPMVALGVISVLKERKFILYGITLFLSVFANYYVGLFTCIFVVLFSICYEICRWRGFKRLYSDILIMAFISILAIGMTAVLELPALAALQTTQSSVNNFPSKFSLNIVNKNTLSALFDAMRQVAGNMNGAIQLTHKEGLPNIFCGIASTMLGFLFLTAKKVNLRDKVCSVLLLLFFILSFVIRQLDYIWHGFHFTNMIPYRFSFLFSFILLFMAYRAYLIRDQFQPWQILAAASLDVCIVLCGYDQANIAYWTLNFSFIFIYTLILLIGSPKLRDKCFTSIASAKRWISMGLCSLIFVEIVLTLVNFSMTFGGGSVKNYPTNSSQTTALLDRLNERENGTLFYRVETTHSQTLNDGALNGYNGISTFTSSANADVTQFMNALGFGAKKTYNRYCYEEASPVANLFLGIKYMLERDGNVEDNAYFDIVDQEGNVYLLENNAYLPLGFQTNNQILNIDFTKPSNAFLFQNQLFTAATGIVANVWTIQQGNLQISGCEEHTTSRPATGYCYYDLSGQSDSTVTYQYNIESDGFMCVYLDLTKRNNFSVWKNGTKLYSESISLPQMLAISDVTSGDQIELRFTCKAGDKGTLNVQSAIMDDSVFQDGYDILSKSTLQLTEFTNTKVSGTIECNRDGVLYTSIPQNGNWYVYVDGTLTESVAIGNAMVGVILSEGHHSISFVYRNKTFTVGAYISIGCLILFIAASAYWYKKHKSTTIEK